jgi:hypothetical protein
MMAILLSLAGYLLYIVCMGVLSSLLLSTMCTTFLSLPKGGLFVASIAIFLPLAFKNFLWLALISELPSTLPSSISEMMPAFLGLAGYLVCMMGLSSLVLAIAFFVCEAAPRTSPEDCPGWIFKVSFGVTVVVMDMFMKHSGHSDMAATLHFAGYLVYVLCMLGLSYLVFEILVFDDTIVPVLPFVLPMPINHQKSSPMIIAGVILVLNDMHGGCVLVERPGFISEFLSALPFSVSGTLPGYLVYTVCMVALSFLVLVIAAGAISKARVQWPMERPELMLTTILGLTFILLNKMWGTPFLKPSSDSSMEEALVGLAGYLVYIMCSMALSGLMSKSAMDALVISLTFVMLDMFNFSDIISTLADLACIIAKALLMLFFLVPLLFVVGIGIYTWISILLPSAGAGSSCNGLTFTTIVGLSFKVMKAMMDTPAILGTVDLVVRYLTVFSDTKATILGVAESINNYQTAYALISYLAVSGYREITRNIAELH